MNGSTGWLACLHLKAQTIYIKKEVKNRVADCKNIAYRNEVV